MSKKIVYSEAAPKAIGPYSVANIAGDLVFTAGQLGLDPATGELVAGGVMEQTRQAMKNLDAVLIAAGSSMGQVIKTTVFLAEMKDFQLMNSVYGEFFTDNYPARSTVQVAGLPKGGSVEIEAVAIRVTG